MAIPPFPAQDLAKLVLGYLVEEQLMTAYDEFLHTSPYLDAQKNEYDRIFMHSLRKILAEYRAVRIHVEACKPIALRKKLLQCNNLLEIVMFLVGHIDVNKLQRDASNERVSFDSQDVSTSKNGCDACNALRLGSCVCNLSKRNMSSSKSCRNTESMDAAETLAQATSLSDLPGNQEPSDNRHVRVLEPQLSLPTANGQNQEQTACPSISNASTEQSSIIANHLIQHPNNNLSSNAVQKSSALPNTTSMECSQNIAEFNTVLKQVYNNSVVTGSRRDNSNIICAERNNTNRMSVAGTFQDFSTGVMGGVAKTNINVPDSSTSENMHVQLPPHEKDIKTLNKRNVKAAQRKKCMFRVGNVKHDVIEISNEIIDVETVDLPTLKPDDQKVTILSDVKVGNDNRLLSLAPTSNNATSTPLLQTQTIFINGTPVFKPKPPEQNYTFTRDEIMAMPTIILVPASGPLQTVSSTSVQAQNVMAKSCSTTTSTNTPAPSFTPLTVDVSNSSSNAINNLPNVHNVPTLDEQTAAGKSGLVKTVEAFKNASVPKDSIVPSSSSTSTPQMLPPKRRSSSTPRRTSHVRVLDFTTPRRILNETIIEDSNQEVPQDNSNEIFISQSPNLSFPQGPIVDNTKNPEPTLKSTVTDSSTTNLMEVNNTDQKKPVIRKVCDWDADLRALAIASESVDKRVPAPKPRSKPKNTKKVEEQKGPDKKPNDTTSADKTKKRTNVKSNVSPNIRSSKKKAKHTGDKNVKDIPCSDLPLKVDTSVNEKAITATKEPDKEQNKSNDDERIDTPEIERLSLHNEIGAKLNISDLLKTPYKQALYDIQIETPRFLGPDLPDVPMSDIKIMDIPTPRFLSSNSKMPYTPKPAQMTPSSYSSRPTDYSSGGSYYKPDDQDYIPNMEDIACPVTSTLSKDNSKSVSAETNKLKESQPKEKCRKNRSRPIRQCTKNVSYYNSPATIKTNDTDKKDDVSSCSDTISVNSSFDNGVQESAATSKGDKTKRSTKGGNNKSPRIMRKLSPLKKVSQKPFMKIKPRRPTPTKDSAKKTIRKLPEMNSNSMKRKSKNRATSKDKGTCVTSLAVPAPTKSRRKSSTPRKLHCTKTLNSESSDHEPPEPEAPQTMQKEIQNSSVSCILDSDTEQLRLRWSDDGSQDTRVSANEADEISQIKEYINKTVPGVPSYIESEGSLQRDLIKRGFDVETAKNIERDLLKTPVNENESEKVIFLEQSTDESKIDKVLERSVESDCSTLATNLVIHEENDTEYVELSVQECNEESANFIVVQHDDNEDPPKHDLPKLKDTFSMEIFIDANTAVRLRATSLKYFPDENDDLEQSTETNRETEIAVNSISNIDRLYSPYKDTVRAQCYEIFNSTLTSIDTPLKTDSPKRNQDCTVAEIVIEEEHIIEKVELKEKTGKRKRKRSHCSSASEESVNDHKVSKKVKPETQYILNSKEIKNLDIETVLSRLHGP